MNPKQWKWNKIRYFLHWTYSNLTPYRFYQEILKYFSDFQNRNFIVLWLKWTQTMEMKRTRHFPLRHIQIWHLIFFMKKCSSISLTFKIKISQFYDYRIPNNGNETKSDIFAWYIFRSDIIFQWSQNTKQFQWLLSLAFFNFIAKLSINK